MFTKYSIELVGTAENCELKPFILQRTRKTIFHWDFR